MNFKMNDFYYLSHGGPGSGRYPLGSGDRPYQKFEGSRRKPSGISGYIRSIKEKRSEAKRQKAKEELAKKEKEVEERKRRHDEDKSRVLKEGSAKEVMRYQGELTNQELQSVVTRLNLESQLRSLSNREVSSGMTKINNLMKSLKTGTEWAKTGTDTYNTFAKIYNATEEGQIHPLKIIK